MMIMTNSGEGWMMNMVSYKEVMAKGLITYKQYPLYVYHSSDKAYDEVIKTQYALDQLGLSFNNLTVDEKGFYLIVYIDYSRVKID